MSLVLITGASSGVGEAAARLFARQGARVLLVARNGDKLKALAAEIGVRSVALPCDASDPVAVEAMAAKVTKDHGTPDVILNSAGAGQWKTVQDTSAEEVITMMQAPYLSAFFVTKAFLPDMLERESGVIIHVNSPACIAPWPSCVGYAASRAALHGFHQALSQDLAGSGVESCHVIFGKIATPYFDNNPGTAEKMPTLDKIIPTLTPEHCARLLTDLARQPQRAAIYPFMLRLLLTTGGLMPPLRRWLIRQ